MSTNAEALCLLRLGLARPCIMPMDFALTNAAGMLDQLAAMKQLAQLLTAEGQLREMDHRPADAARSYMDAIRFGNELSRGGLLITRLVGIAGENIGFHALVKVVPMLKGQEARFVVKGLEKIDAGRVTWTEIAKNEPYYAHHLPGNRFNPIGWGMSWWANREVMQRAEAKDRTAVAHVRLLAAELALRCYQSDQGHVPANLNDLVTNYLSTLPQDPFSAQRLVYRAQGTNWLLYSIGPDGMDDGGIPARKGWPVKGDLLYDSPW